MRALVRYKSRTHRKGEWLQVVKKKSNTDLFASCFLFDAYARCTPFRGFYGRFCLTAAPPHTPQRCSWNELLVPPLLTFCLLIRARASATLTSALFHSAAAASYTHLWKSLKLTPVALYWRSDLAASHSFIASQDMDWLPGGAPGLKVRLNLYW